jgi:hypothetical protein
MSGAIDQDFNATTDIHREGKFATNQFRKHTGNKPIPVTARKDDAPAAYQEGLVAMADLALNHRLAKGTLGGIVRGFDIFDLKEVQRPSATGNNLWQGPTVFVHCVRSPGRWPNSTTCSSMATNA